MVNLLTTYCFLVTKGVGKTAQREPAIIGTIKASAYFTIKVCMHPLLLTLRALRCTPDVVDLYISVSEAMQ